jgi:serine/threonine protein kinase
MKAEQGKGLPPSDSDQGYHSDVAVRNYTVAAHGPAHGTPPGAKTVVVGQPPPLPGPVPAVSNYGSEQPSSENLYGPAMAAPVAAEPVTIERYGQYEIIRELGRGGMGVVYLARDGRLGRRVAVKVLQTKDPDHTRRFIDEARTTAQCGHENIVVIHEVGEQDQSPFMVLEYLQGQTLASMLKKSGAMHHTRAVELMVSVVRALVYAHALGIVHRDLKPENIFLTDAGTVKVLDFGIAKVLREESGGRELHPERGQVEVHEPGSERAGKTGIVGTVAYMSPEQWIVGGKVDHRTDIWAAGVTLYEMLSGQHPLEEVPYWSVANLELPMPDIRQAAPHVPPELADAVNRCLSKARDQRFANAAELLKALEPFLPGRFMPWLQVDKGPFAGLRSFEEKDAACFFGRSREIAAMTGRIHDWPVMAVVGPSGVGKSSFIRAGIVPTLKRSGYNWRILIVRPGREAVLSLARMLASLAAEDEGAAPLDENQLGIRLALEPGFLGSELRSRARRTGEHYLIFVDQFEELFTLVPDQRQRVAFTTCLAAAADDATSPLRVIVSIRSDFLGRVAEDPHFMGELSRGLFFLGPLSPEGLREALVHPAEMVGYRFETQAMVDEMLAYLAATPGALPLLQFTASQLWEARDPARKLLTEESYRGLGGITGALVSHADRVVNELSPEQYMLCRAVFLQLVTHERTRAVRHLDELRELSGKAGDLDQVINHLVESRLLVVQTGGGSGGATVEIVHESLIENWTTLRRWLEESHEDSLFIEQLRAAARQWEAKRRDPGLLWGGEMAEELGRFMRRFRGEMPDVVLAFSEGVQGQRERGARLKRRLAMAGAAFLLVLLAAASVALIVISNAHKTAEQNAQAATLAKEEAHARLREVEEKERERQQAEAQRLAAEKLKAKAEEKADEASIEVEETQEQLAIKNAELTRALRRAKDERLAAEKAQTRAEKNEDEARAAEERAQRSAKELERLLKKERERANRLTAQLGSPIVEDLR